MAPGRCFAFAFAVPSMWFVVFAWCTGCLAGAFALGLRISQGQTWIGAGNIWLELDPAMGGYPQKTSAPPRVLGARML